MNSCAQDNTAERRPVADPLSLGSHSHKMEFLQIHTTLVAMCWSNLGGSRLSWNVQPRLSRYVHVYMNLGLVMWYEKDSKEMLPTATASN